MTLVLALVAVVAAAVLGWRLSTVWRVERLLDELDRAVADNASLMRQKAALLEQSDERGRRVLALLEGRVQAGRGVGPQRATEWGAL